MTVRDKHSDPVTGEWSGDTFALAESAIPQLDAARQRTVRLVISIPVLIMLIVIGSGTSLYYYLINYSEQPPISTSTLLEVERSTTRAQTVEKLRAETAQFQSRMEAMALKLLLLSIAISVAAAIVGYVLARQIVRPIRDLTETMDALAKGDFSTKLAPITLGEFGQLGSSFNRMVEQLNCLFEERDRQLRESFNSAHLSLNSRGEVIHADHAARRVLGESDGGIMGRNLLADAADIPLLKANPRFQAMLSELVADAGAGNPAGRSVNVRNVEGGTSRYLVSTIRMEAAAPSANEIMVEIRDITGMASFYEQIQRADRLAAVGTLATGIAHEIRNPLASIRGMVQLMAEDASKDDPNSTYHARIIREVDRLEKLIAGIMSFAHKEAAPPEHIDLNSLLTEVTESARLHVGDGARAIPVQWELDANLPQARLQGERLRQALLNLLVNAFQHCAATGRGPVRVQTIHLPVNQQRPLIICIANPAEQLDDVQRERIFEPFYTTKPEGTGLGLPISYQTVASNGGMLEVEFDEGEIQFWVRLPLEMQQSTGSRILPRLEPGMVDRR